jgi:hypothetical protein
MFNGQIDHGHMATWCQAHYVVIPGALRGAALCSLQDWTRSISEWPEQPGKWMKYFETGTSGVRQLCRVENFIPYHEGFSDLLSGSRTLEIVSILMGEPAVLFKEKVNFKLPGASGFKAHQDAPAFNTFGHRYHITMMVAIDDSTIENGCLEISNPVEVYTLLPQADDKTVAPTIETQLSWRPLEVSAGDIVFFDSYIPHRSAVNHSQNARRAIFSTYNRCAEGSVRDQYFAEKRISFPPECERVLGVDYAVTNSPYNVGNPIR